MLGRESERMNNQQVHGGERSESGVSMLGRIGWVRGLYFVGDRFS